MITLRRTLVFMGVYFLISVVTCALTVVWVFSSTPTMEVFTESPFVFSAKSNTTYTLFVGTLDAEEPSPHFDTVQVSAAWAGGTAGPKINLERDAGTTQIASHDQTHGDVKAISIAR